MSDFAYPADHRMTAIDMHRDPDLVEAIEDLRKTFTQYGPIARISAIGPVSSQCVLIDFVERKAALLAALQTNCHVFGDQTVVVELDAGSAPSAMPRVKPW